MTFPCEVNHYVNYVDEWTTHKLTYEGVKEMEQFKRGSKNQMVQGNLTQAGGLRYLVRYLTKWILLFDLRANNTKCYLTAIT